METTIKLITGPVSWYIDKNPQRLDPTIAKPGDKFFINGHPLQKYIFSALNINNTFNSFEMKTGRLIEFSFGDLLVVDNPEHLNLTDASNHIVDNKAIRIALPVSIARALGVKFNDKIKIIFNDNGKIKTLICDYTDTQHDNLCRCGHHKDDHTYYRDAWDCMYCSCNHYEQRIGDFTKGAFTKLASITLGLIWVTIQKVGKNNG